MGALFGFDFYTANMDPHPKLSPKALQQWQDLARRMAEERARLRANTEAQNVNLKKASPSKAQGSK
jgi:hypothetical protein